MPLELLEAEPRQLRDVAVGEEAWIARHGVAVSKRGRTYLQWTAELQEKPENPYSAEWKVRVCRLERGFSLTVRSNHQFGRRSILWGYFAP